MAKAISEVKILSNSVKQKDAWIPLDSVAFIEVRISSNFWKIFFYSMMIGSLIASLMFWGSLEFPSGQENIKIRNFFLAEWAFFDFIHPLAPVCFGYFLAYALIPTLFVELFNLKFSKIIRIVSTSGDSIFGIYSKGWFILALEKFSNSAPPDDYEVLPQRILEAKEIYIKCLKV